MEELGRAYGVSEIVIRHAVSLLRLEGLVETRWNSSASTICRWIYQRADRHRQPIGPVPTPNSTAHGAPAAGAPWTACVLAA